MPVDFCVLGLKLPSQIMMGSLDPEDGFLLRIKVNIFLCIHIHVCVCIYMYIYMYQILWDYLGKTVPAVPVCKEE